MWGKALKVRSWMLLLLVMHFLVHPMTHALAAYCALTDSHSLSAPAQGDLGTSRALDNCDLCRVGQSVTTAPDAAKVELLTPQWIPVRLQAVSYESLLIAPKLLSRAPPSL